ncbi:MAG TPA: electron transfer flavoprotein subunit beta/FixA family protein [Candidatus Gastranaerophilaceae bacterium]|nr:electron transfer flavoprotein subunit beta/FixA family protein [Candidatus Gastranaerophilaceae bacterium]HPT41893.1 electron transfer flavoprotein subunit beta/FixA family protein [Candidatus Gastranaerophilaceae bacterium]
MKVALCIKQVPDTADIKWTENNTIQREGVESVINPFDMYAIETAVRLKENFKDVHITVLSMGPPQAQDILKRAISMGVDEGFLVSDKKFAGADTVATSRTLATAIKEKVKDVDLIICGQFATDGDTAQTGPSIAQQLNFPQVTYVKEIVDYKDGFLTVKREVEDGIEIIRTTLPAVLCMLKCDYEPRRPLINGFVKAQNAQINMYNAEDIKLQPEQVGIKGSPTYVSRAFRPEQKQGGDVITPETPQKGAEIIKEKLKEFEIVK